jgi:hypothetical protein
MHFPVRVRLVVSSFTLAATAILVLAATVLAGGGPIPFPK